ncbi:MAG: hypothetical protein LBL94_07155 [Prevotellaceae bacterium]|jgi:hypothetical protein|nr:hypothetical protein [Prevotellaceae bacterium]
MRTTTKILFTIATMTLFACSQRPANDTKMISEQQVRNVTNELKAKVNSSMADFRIEKGVAQVAALWQSEDGTADDFRSYCLENFVADTAELFKAYKVIGNNFEIIGGYNNGMSVRLLEPLHLEKGEIHPLDEIFGAYSPAAHVTDDMFANKIAFFVLLNFPAYTLQEKTENMNVWTRREWAYARLADGFMSRTPARLVADEAKAFTDADTYISQYNIYLGNLVDGDGKTFFPKDLKLNSHWGLRDELKSDYPRENALEKQRLIYSVMKRIINQTIPQCVVNSDTYLWNPETNQVFDAEKEVTDFASEPYTRYQYWLNNFRVEQAIDKYNPLYPTFIQRSYDGAMELSQQEIETLFTGFIAAPEIKQVAELIRKRLGRDLEPFDIWYDGFKSRSALDEDALTAITSKRYPDAAAFKSDIPRIIESMGWTKEKAACIADKIVVDPARGSGHAWAAEMKGDAAHLRTRIQPTGMDYKGYNIAVHELGHNVEQTITLYDMDYYFLKSVPSTAFTEAVAFMFQNSDLKLLGQKPPVDKVREDALAALDNCWMAYEIMGVSLVDMYAWQWLYDHPRCTAKEFCIAVETISKDVWNKYYAPVLGEKNSPLLAIYSHLICVPMYLANYPVGHLIQFQVEEHCRGKNFADEITRMLLAGSVTPQKWMRNAVGSEISGQPTLSAVQKALELITQ